MEARIKKIFHRKKDDSPESSLAEDHGSEAPKNSIPHIVLDNSTPPRNPPDTGTNHIRGENSTVASPHRTSPISGGRAARSPPRSPHDGLRDASTTVSSERHIQRHTGEMGAPDAAGGSGRRDDRHRKLPEIPVSPTFSGLDFGNESTMRGSVQASPKPAGSRAAGYQTSQFKSPLRSDLDPRVDIAKGPRGDETLKTMEELAPAPKGPNPPQSFAKATDYPRKHTPYLTAADSKTVGGDPEGDKTVLRGTVIPRKEPASPRRVPHSDRYPLSRLHDPLPAEPKSPIPSATGITQGQYGVGPRVTSSSRPTSRDRGTLNPAETVLEKAQSNSSHTEIIETIAPAVVHETVRQDVHEVRQEVITREIHNHDYYHRILPVVDVEVLPARHFLPVEGGGLVEVSADEVPGRGRHWVVAETASKVPSDGPAPQGINRFSARDFPGRDGDSKKYITPEGYERTEETWVHPPELETGGRDTGQTWPFVLGNDPNTHGKLGSPHRGPSR